MERRKNEYLQLAAEREVKETEQIKLTVTAGLRYDYQPLGHELYYRNSGLGPTTPNLTADGRPGAVIYEG
jgi:hypothetical protein